MFTQGRARNGVYTKLLITGSDAVKTERQTKWAQKHFFPWIWVLSCLLCEQGQKHDNSGCVPVDRDIKPSSITF